MTKYLPPHTAEQTRAYANVLVYSFPRLLEAAGEKRITKGAQLARWSVRHNEHPGHYEVESQSRNNGYYLVIPKERSCTCPDSRAGNVCKHRIAVAIQTIAVDLLLEIMQKDRALGVEILEGRI